jgi:DNA-binding NarL/FixJ family response regulator
MSVPQRRVAIVEDDSRFRETFAEMIAASDSWVVAGSHVRAESALEAVPADPPDAVIVDIQLPGMSGIELVRKLKPRCRATQFLMVTVFEDADKVFEALAAGASGYVLKRDVHARLLESLDEVMNGGAPMSSAIARKVVQHFQIPVQEPGDEFQLTHREKATLDLLVKGYFYKEIASNLGIQIDTVAFHLGNIYRKLQVRTRSEAILKYINREAKA